MSAVRRLGGRPKAPDGGRPGWVSFRCASPRTSTDETWTRTRRPYVLTECAAHQRQRGSLPAMSRGATFRILVSELSGGEAAGDGQLRSQAMHSNRSVHRLEIGATTAADRSDSNSAASQHKGSSKVPDGNWLAPIRWTCPPGPRGGAATHQPRSMPAHRRFQGLEITKEKQRVSCAARYSPRRLCLRRSELRTHHQSPPAPGNGAVWSPHYAS